MSKIQDLVRTFHLKYNFHRPAYPTVPLLFSCLNRVRLIQEELTELSQAYLDGDLVAIADALGDLEYLINGAAVEAGIDLEPVTLEIHRSNMTKDVPPEYYGKPLKGEAYELPQIKPIVEAQLV